MDFEEVLRAAEQVAEWILPCWHTLGIQEGEWCDHCLLPSVAVVSAVATTRSGSILSGVQQVSVCRGCGRQS